ncbi:MAG TPA: hypothetical protein PLR50_05995, partial [Candidatus Rifleibacterium sp.]|nr:hypothetical protein [Candidatus Rifleibacterium sp.]
AVSPLPGNAATAPELPSTGGSNQFDSINDLGKAEDLYYQYFAEYNRLMAASGSRQQILEAQTKMLQAKERVKILRRSLK